MIRLVTQYTNLNRRKEVFPIGNGWDGAKGPWLFHAILDNDTQISKATYAEQGGMTIHDWLDETNHITNFRLEFIYE